jgi:hypothetical protein
VRIKGYDHEVTEFANRADADRALRTACVEDRDIITGIVVPIPMDTTFVVRLFKGEKGEVVYYL